MKVWRFHHRTVQKSENLIYANVGIKDVHEVQKAARAAKTETEREAIVLSRIGQGEFRRDVLKLHAETCPITGVHLGAALRASHIKPWSECDNNERLDPYNGLALAPHVDWLFDRGFISFENDGTIMISEQLSSDVLEKWSIDSSVRLVFNKKSLKYLDWHRRYVFKKPQGYRRRKANR